MGQRGGARRRADSVPRGTRRGRGDFMAGLWQKKRRWIWETWGKMDMGGVKGETGRLPEIFLAGMVVVLHAGSSCFHITRGLSPSPVVAALQSKTICVTTPYSTNLQIPHKNIMNYRLCIYASIGRRSDFRRDGGETFERAFTSFSKKERASLAFG